MPSVATERFGALADLSSDVLLAALQEVERGEIFDLGMEISEGMPQGARGNFVPFSLVYSATPEFCTDEWPFSFAAETIIGTLHTSTHIDAFVHVQHEGKTFGGHEARDIRSDRGWSRYGAETIAPILTRGVILDVAGALGREPLEDGYEITVDDLRAAGVDKARVRRGDAVLVRTGKIAAQYLSDPVAYGKSGPGIGVAAAQWLADLGMAVLGTDTPSTEPLPFRDPSSTVHRALLIERGVHLVENLFLDDVVAAGIQSGVFVCLPLKLRGATGSWVRPVIVC
jgi:kynurenine formamidase